jgi:hypothetical protein
VAIDYLAGMRTRQSTMVIVLAAVAATAAVAWAVSRRGWLQLRKPRRPAITQSLVPLAPAAVPLGPPGSNLERRLDEALLETYPASDPVSICVE